MDLDYIHCQFMAAIKGIANGKGLAEVVAVPPFGQQVRIGQALSAAGEHLSVAFHDEDADSINAAFHAFGASRSSDRIDACSISLMELSKMREPRDPTSASFESREAFSIRFIRAKDKKAFKADIRYTSEYPRTYEALIRFADDGSQTIRDQFKGPLIDIELGEGMLRDSVRRAVEDKIASSEAV
ncbi:hypothetical protein AB7714_19855 [Tardiphaga sp. 1201_B9_N1_1]|uniref:hypothetical protein n=1 Tax=unclassified Tardiphaga TaxID=2631404 RepID=UPI003F200143